VLPFVVSYAVVAVLLVGVIQKVRPQWSSRRVIWASAISGPILVVVAAAVGIAFILLGPHMRDEVDSSSMTALAIISLSAISIPASLAAGGLVGWLVTSIFRRSTSE
jgi:hypothetical protein